MTIIKHKTPCPVHKHRGRVRVVARPRGAITIQAPRGEAGGIDPAWERP